MSTKPPFSALASRVVSLPTDDVDTDQIVPARYLKTTNKTGLGAALFADWRLDPDGEPRPEFPLNMPDAEGAQVLVAGRNFGCGSSREHAVWALTGWGIRAVIALSFGDIFRSNALKNGLLPLEVDAPFHAALLAARAADPSLAVTIDLEGQHVRLPDGKRGDFPIEAFAKRCLLQGVDELGYLLSFVPQIEAHEARRACARSGPAAETDGMTEEP
jgi:3-isopropylmalate/(R)-2-methylmalate dehydratase small subunit